MRSLVVLGAAAAVFILFLVRNERNAQEILRAERAAVERLTALAKGSPAPPSVEGGYRFQWLEGGDLPPLLLAFPEQTGVSVFAAAPGGGVYAYEVYDEDEPDVMLLRIHFARKADPPTVPPGWRKIR